MIDFNFENNNELQSGSILVSEPFLSDDFFTRSVIYLCDHNEDGSFGFVLNKYVENDMSDFVEDFPTVSSKIGLGGPVDTSNIFYIHSLGTEIENSIPCGKDLFIGGDFEQLKTLLAKHPEKSKNIRFFIGYSGWTKDQLTDELDQKSWIVLNNVQNEQILNTENDNIWKNILEKLGGKFKVMSGFPINPSDN